MLSGMRIFTTDPVWREILADLNAAVLDVPNDTAIDFDALNIAPGVNMMDLKAAILSANDNTDILTRVFGAPTRLPHLHAEIVALLYKTGGISITGIKNAIGYAPDATTHVIDNAIYQLRRTYGRDFIKNDNGVYRLGRI